MPDLSGRHPSKNRGFGVMDARRGGVTYVSQGDILRYRQEVGLALWVWRAENDDISLKRLERGYKQKDT